MNEQNLIKILEINEIHKIPVCLNSDDIEKIKTILNGLSIQYVYKVLILSSFMYDVDPNIVLSYCVNKNTAGRSTQATAPIMNARCLWVNLLNELSGLNASDISNITTIPVTKIQRWIKKDYKKEYIFGTLFYDKYKSAKEILLNIH